MSESFTLFSIGRLETIFLERKPKLDEYQYRAGLGIDRLDTMMAEVDEAQEIPTFTWSDLWDPDPGTFFAGLTEDCLYHYYPRKWQEWLRIHLGLAYYEVDEPMFWHRLQYRYARHLLSSKPIPYLLEPQSYRYSFADCLPCRDRLVHLDSLQHIGRVILDHSWADGRTGIELLWRKLLSPDCELFQAVEETWGKNLRNVTDPERSVLIENVWDMVCHCHEVGRTERDVRFETHVGRMSSRPGVAKVLERSWRRYRQERERLGRQQMDHGLLTQSCLFDECRGVIDDMPGQVAASLILALVALSEHNEILSNIDSPNYSGGLNTPRKWEENPLGAFLATVILLEDIAVKLCWHSTRIDLHEQEWKPNLVDPIVPVLRLTAMLEDDGAEFVFGVDPDSDFKEIVDIDATPPVGEKRLGYLKEALGPACLGLLTTKQYQGEVAFRWDVVGGERKERLGPPVPEEAEIEEWQEECEEASGAAEEAIGAARKTIKYFRDEARTAAVARELGARSMYEAEATKRESRVTNLEMRLGELRERCSRERSKNRRDEVLQELKAIRREALVLASREVTGET